MFTGIFTGIFNGLIIYIRGLLGYRRYFLGNGICSNGIGIFGSILFRLLWCNLGETKEKCSTLWSCRNRRMLRRSRLLFLRQWSLDLAYNIIRNIIFFAYFLRVWFLFSLIKIRL